MRERGAPDGYSNRPIAYPAYFGLSVVLPNVSKRLLPKDARRLPPSAQPYVNEPRASAAARKVPKPVNGGEVPTPPAG